MMYPFIAFYLTESKLLFIINVYKIFEKTNLVLALVLRH